MRHIIVFSGFWFVDYYECTNNYFRMIKCIGSSVQWKQKEMSHYGAQEDMMAEQGLLGICWNGKERSQVWENVFTGKAASIKTFKTVQIPYIHYEMSQRWPLGYMMIQTWDLWPGDQGAQDMHTNEFCARIVTKWILIFHH